MFTRASTSRGSTGDAPARTQGGGDARPRSGREPCVYYLQGRCRKGDQCRFRHIQQPTKNGNRRISNAVNRGGGRGSLNSGRRNGNRQPGRKQQGGRQPTRHNCGIPGHFKKDCRRQNDFFKAAFDFALPAVELFEPVQDKEYTDKVHIAEQQQFKRTRNWLLDGGATCHVPLTRALRYRTEGR